MDHRGWPDTEVEGVRFYRFRLSIALTSLLSLLLVGCGSTTTSAGSPKVSGTPSLTPSGSPTLANVVSAGSLQLLMDKYMGPPFIAQTGDEYQNQSAGSVGLAQEIAAGELTPNVFVPIGSAPMAIVEPTFTTWAVQFAASPLVVAYYPQGQYASELKKISEGKLPITNLFTLMATPGFKLGRTDPAVDPQGQGFVMMVQLAEQYLGISAATASAVLGGTNDSSQIFSETALEPTLQAGELDAASAYLPQAVQLGLPYVTLPNDINFGDPADASIYEGASMTLSTGTVVHGSLLDLEASVLSTTANPATPAATAFVEFLLSPAARTILKNEGYTLRPPTLVGTASAAPQGVRDLTTTS
jgi:molybdate/tungstate transport system substrate-binding protein